MTARGFTHHDDAIAGSNRAIAKLMFFDDAYNLLGEAESTAIDASSPHDTWIPLDVTASAPAGTTRVQALMEFLQCVGTTTTCWDPGAVYFDQAVLERL